MHKRKFENNSEIRTPVPRENSRHKTLSLLSAIKKAAVNPKISTIPEKPIRRGSSELKRLLYATTATRGAGTCAVGFIALVRARGKCRIRKISVKLAGPCAFRNERVRQHGALAVNARTDLMRPFLIPLIKRASERAIPFKSRARLDRSAHAGANQFNYKL